MLTNLNKIIKSLGLAVLFNSLLGCIALYDHPTSMQPVYKRITVTAYMIESCINPSGDCATHKAQFIYYPIAVTHAPVMLVLDTLLIPWDLATWPSRKIRYYRDYFPVQKIPQIAVNLSDTPIIYYKFDTYNDYMAVPAGVTFHRGHYVSIPSPYDQLAPWQERELELHWKENLGSLQVHTEPFKLLRMNYTRENKVVLVTVFLPCQQVKNVLIRFDEENISKEMQDKIIKEKLTAMRVDDAYQTLKDQASTNQCPVKFDNK